MNSASRPFAAGRLEQAARDGPVAGTVAPVWRRRSTTSRNPRHAERQRRVPNLSFAVDVAFRSSSRAGDGRLADSLATSSRRAAVGVRASVAASACSSRAAGAGAPRPAATARGVSLRTWRIPGGLPSIRMRPSRSWSAADVRVKRGPGTVVRGVFVCALRRSGNAATSPSTRRPSCSGVLPAFRRGGTPASRPLDQRLTLARSPPARRREWNQVVRPVRDEGAPNRSTARDEGCSQRQGSGGSARVTKRLLQPGTLSDANRKVIWTITHFPPRFLEHAGPASVLHPTGFPPHSPCRRAPPENQDTSPAARRH